MSNRLFAFGFQTHEIVDTQKVTACSRRLLRCPWQAARYTKEDQLRSCQPIFLTQGAAEGLQTCDWGSRGRGHRGLIDESLEQFPGSRQVCDGTTISGPVTPIPGLGPSTLLPVNLFYTNFSDPSALNPNYELMDRLVRDRKQLGTPAKES